MGKSNSAMRARRNSLLKKAKTRKEKNAIKRKMV